MSRVMLITGASRGIGAATARLAAAEGYALCLNYHHRQDAAQQLLDELQRSGARAIAVAADVADEAQVAALFAAIDAEFGRLDVLVNNAGMLERQMRLEDMDAARLARVLAVNVTGSFLCAREAVRRMSTLHGGNGGAIVNVSSIAAKLGAPNEYIDYAAAKGAIDSMTLGLAKEVAAEGIRVNAVRPGVIRTEIHASGGEPGRVERVKASVPMGRGGEAEEVAQAILWLASAKASYTSGALLDVSGGR
ncbi:SDR family oxidoreductase [Pseudomonas stutzeri]|jgi:NAD(P)-dependent dehydrogenase (short-subunit alcohol dehydrogenase family)|uniref:KR domain-containing protein n=1 Tax=Stutzerimonas stutzeri TaxID=316 RepID=A0A2N8T0U1_STUST|nr:SDR family oxidoreductase [Stutzerimonas stutzeri]EQM77565.1 oxidoreductase [Stutzerimonas stutzeri MF28]MCQ4250444.1 SDR family oxidoreductase [Stutzerimonas stutzeri]PNG08346.1 KR domain-containing protein [Stutzerimonas stutzeri]